MAKPENIKVNISADASQLDAAAEKVSEHFSAVKVHELIAGGNSIITNMEMVAQGRRDEVMLTAAIKRWRILTGEESER
jgi:hypothetical protein